MTWRDKWREGADAFELGVPMVNNPYDPMLSAMWFNSWHAGWLAAEAKAKTKEFRNA